MIMETKVGIEMGEKVVKKLGYRQVSSSEISIEAHVELPRNCIFSDVFIGEKIIMGLKETILNFGKTLPNYSLRR